MRVMMSFERELRSLRVVRPKRLYEQIAEQIRERISDGTFPPGSALPPERELAEMVGVSRPSIREALIALETIGLTEARAGGNFVRADAGGLQMIPIGNKGDLGPGVLEQFEARRAIEITCSELAARRATEEEMDLLAASVQRMAELVAAGVSPAGEHRVFHTQLAAASHNQILAATVNELWRVREGAMWSSLRTKVDNAESWALGIAFRRQLLAALRARDPDAAAAETRAHFDRVEAMYFGAET